MCGRYVLYASAEKIATRFRTKVQINLTPSYNIAPSQLVPIVREVNESRQLAMLTWGLVPFWAKAAKTAYRMINARAETVATKPAFRTAYRQRRCLIPADGFYEWQTGPYGKQPYHIGLKDGDLFAFAGLWERWEGEAGQVLESCAIIVTAANDLLRSIHERMPVILEPKDYALWLDNKSFDATRLETLLKPYPAEKMEAYAVSNRVNNPKNADESCIAPLRG
jgi:putative SOS response-associated peptidase YedK